MRLPGESETDVVRRTYQDIRDPEKRLDRAQHWRDYLDKMHVKYETEVQIAKVVADLEAIQKPAEMTKEKLLVKCKEFLDRELYSGAIIHYILSKESKGKRTFHGFAEYEEELAIYFSISEKSVFCAYMGDTHTDYDLLALLEAGYKIEAMTREGHLGVWYELGTTDMDDITHIEGLEDYLLFCKEKYISVETIAAMASWPPQDLFEIAEQLTCGRHDKELSHNFNGAKNKGRR